MIFFGIRSVNIAKELSAVRCTYCQSEKSIWLFIYQKYVHIFWIPFFPIGRTMVSSCSHCKQVLGKKEFEPVMREAAQVLDRSTKTPWWAYFTLWLLLVFFVLSVFIGILGNR